MLFRKIRNKRENWRDVVIRLKKQLFFIGGGKTKELEIRCPEKQRRQKEEIGDPAKLEDFVLRGRKGGGSGNTFYP